jgi:hypothetical protein
MEVSASEKLYKFTAVKSFIVQVQAGTTFCEGEKGIKYS